MITFENVCLKKSNTDVLSDISFEAHAGKVTAFVGPNGAGKSTAINILLGLEFADSGQALIGGKAYKEFHSPLRHVGVMLDRVGAPKFRSVATHLKLVAMSNGIPPSSVGEVLEKVGAAHKANSKIGQLSLGESQRVSMALSLLGDPPVLLLDEPTNGLDPSGIRWFRTFVTDLAKQGKAVLLTSHMLAEVEKVADHIVVLNRGQIVLSKDAVSAKHELKNFEDLFFELTEGDNPDV